MLGINTPKVLAKGDFAKAVLKAAQASKGMSADNMAQTSKYPYKFEWNH